MLYKDIKWYNQQWGYNRKKKKNILATWNLKTSFMFKTNIIYFQQKAIGLTLDIDNKTQTGRSDI